LGREIISRYACSIWLLAVVGKLMIALHQNSSSASLQKKRKGDS